MAIRPSTVYPSQVDTSDLVGYPYGAAQNDAVIGDGQGTPLERQWVKDLFGWEQALLNEAGLTPNNLQEKVGLSQYLSAIKIIGDARSKNASQRLGAMTWPERAAFGSAAAVNTPLAVAWAPNFGGTTGGTYCLLDTSKTAFVSKDGGLSWLATATLANWSTLKPEMAYGLIDGVPAFMSNGGSVSNFYTTIDGSSWTAQTSGPTFSNWVPCYSPPLNRWVALGPAGLADYCAGTTAGMAIWGHTTTVPGSWVTNSGGCKRLLWNGTLFVGLPVSAYNKCLTSPDGITWTERAFGTTQTWTGLAYSPTDGLWMAIADSTAIATSPDAITWSFFNSTLARANDLAVNGSTWVIATQSGGYGGVAYSVDKGVTWLPLPVGKHTVATAGWNRILFGDSRFLVAHADGTQIEASLSLRAP